MHISGKRSRTAARLVLLCALPVAATVLLSRGLASAGDIPPMFSDLGIGVAEAAFVAVVALLTIWLSGEPIRGFITLGSAGAPAGDETLPNALGFFRLRGKRATAPSAPAPAAQTAEAPAAPAAANCRFCGTPLTRSLVDLGAQPLSNCYLRQSQLTRPEPTWPLHAFVCESCLLVQIDANEAPERIFSDYAYFSSYSESWLRHAETYANDIIQRLFLDDKSQVIEVASNDGYLLQYFVNRGIPSLGIEPAANVAEVAVAKGIPTKVFFLNTTTARQLVSEGYEADLVIGNNVLAHNPNLNDFVAALRILLKPDGTLTMEFPHLLRLIEDTQFDTIYHEHFSYFSLLAVRRVFAEHGLRIFDVDCLPTHGGSLRIYAARVARGDLISHRVHELEAKEQAAGLDKLETYDQFAERVRKTKRRLVKFLIEAKEGGKTVVGYGAAAKGNTLLNYCGARADMIDYVADANPHKQGAFLPGTRIPIVGPDRLRETRPDYVLILPWNLKDEIVAKHGYIREWGGRFVVPVPELAVIS